MQTLFCVRVYPSHFDAELAQSALKSSKIRATIMNDSIKPRSHVLFDQSVQLFVPKKDARRASEILAFSEDMSDML